MSLGLLVLLGFCLLNVGLLIYLIYVKKSLMSDSRAKAGLITTLFFLIPIIFLTLWQQHHAQDRLQHLGFTPYAGFKSSSGIATGLGEKRV